MAKKPAKKPSKSEAIPQRKAMAMSLPVAQSATMSLPTVAPVTPPVAMKKGGKVCCKK